MIGSLSILTETKYVHTKFEVLRLTKNTKNIMTELAIKSQKCFLKVAVRRFLFDIHGTDDDTDPNGNFMEVIIGTDHGRSRKALTDDEYWGTAGSNSKSLFDLLKEKKIRAYPTKLEEEKDETHMLLDGGYTIKKYGTDGINQRLIAIQIEVVDFIRKRQYCRESFAADLAECIFSFVNQFL
jgi:hypothetical protein